MRPSNEKICGNFFSLSFSLQEKKNRFSLATPILPSKLIFLNESEEQLSELSFLS
jgi:hypothetical protein